MFKIFCCSCNGGRGLYMLAWPIHPLVFQCEGPGFARSSRCLHIAGAWHRVMCLFDYCLASWHVLLIDGHCVPAAAGLLVSPVQNSLKDSSVRPYLLSFTFPALLHFITLSPFPYHLLSIPPVTLSIIQNSNILLPSLFSSVFPCLWKYC